MGAIQQIETFGTQSLVLRLVHLFAFVHSPIRCFHPSVILSKKHRLGLRADSRSIMSQHIFPEEPALKPLKSLPDHGSTWATAASASDPPVTPFSAKALYVIGTLRHSVEAADKLLYRDGRASWRGAFYVSAYLELATGVELLGRCLRGDWKTGADSESKRLRRGLSYIGGLDSCDMGATIITTRSQSYTICQCKMLRNYAAHGSAITESFASLAFDPEFISELQRLLTDGVQHYWAELMNPHCTEIRENLAGAAVLPIMFRCRPIHVEETYRWVCNSPDMDFGSGCCDAGEEINP